MKVQLNDYNSGCFGMRMADVASIGQSITDWELNSLFQDATQLKVEHLAAKIPTSNKIAVNKLLSSGFYLVDTQVEYESHLPVSRVDSSTEEYSIRSLKPEDEGVLKAIATSSFNSTRWHSDPYLPMQLCDAYYSQWVESCIQGYAQHILVGETEGKVVSFMTLRASGNDGRIDLTAVSKDYRRRGFYRVLVDTALAWASEQGLTRMLATTQIDNLGSRRTWTSAGFKPGDSNYVLHAYLPSINGRRSGCGSD